MMCLTIVVLYLLAAISMVFAVPTPEQGNVGKFSLAFAATVNLTGWANIAEADRARAAALCSNALARQNGKRSEIPVVNNAVIYTASVGIGSDNTKYTLLIDTGSSNTWVGARKPYHPSRTSKKTKNTVHVSYGSGAFVGDEYTDTVTLSSDLVIKAQSIGVATKAEGFPDIIDGILGIGPVDLTLNTLSSASEKIPTVTDNLASAGTIPQNSIAIYYVPASRPDATGFLDFGAADSSKYTGSISYVPITTTSPANHYWGIDQSISYGGNTILSSTSGVVDTGTTLVLLGTSAFNAYKDATGGIKDPATGLLKISKKQYSALKTLDFHIGSNTYSLSANAQIWPRSLNSNIGGDSDSIYLVTTDLGAVSGSGLDFVNGYAFLERFYSVYDTTNSRVGFATTQYTTSTSN